MQATLLEATKYYELHTKPVQELDTHYQVTTLQGIITFYGTPKNIFAIYLIDIVSELRVQGLFRSLIEYLISQVMYDQIAILAVGSPMLDKILQTSKFGGKYFVCQGGDFIWTR